jgi:hypothetical protein
MGIIYKPGAGRHCRLFPGLAQAIVVGMLDTLGRTLSAV